MAQANWHMAVALTATAIVVVDIVLRLGRWDEGYPSLVVTILSLLAGSLVAYGGSLVYDYEFNVEQDNGTPRPPRRRIACRVRRNPLRPPRIRPSVTGGSCWSVTGYRWSWG